MKKNIPGIRKKIQGYNVLCFNTTTLISELGDSLDDSEPFVAMYFITVDKIVFSLRSCKTYSEAVDVEVIAKSFGGGGHKHAAGFSMSLDEFDFNSFFTSNVLSTFKLD